MYTYQDFKADARNSTVGSLVQRIISEHRSTKEYQTALRADRYDRQQNETVLSYIRYLYNADGNKVPDTTASNNRICSNYFARLNTQRVTYSLGNGVTFEGEGVKERLGTDFDTKLKDAGYYSQIHGTAFVFLNVDHIHVFKLTEFAPLWDEENGKLRAGVRFWQVDTEKPMIAVLYEEDGYTKLKGSSSGDMFQIIQEIRPYKIITKRAAADAEPEVILSENYPLLPIVPMYGSRLKQSTLIGMQPKIDAYDLVSSGYANNLEDCAEIYWLISGAGGMDDSDMARFRDKLRFQHIANIGDDVGVTVTPYTQQIPTEAKESFLQSIRQSIYEDFGALDVSSISAASKTATEITAAYQPMDENADDFEYQIIQTVQQLLYLIGIEDTPVFKRNRVCNQKEQTEMVIESAQYLDDETILAKLPFLTPDEIDGIIYRKKEDEAERYATEEPEATDTDEEEDDVNV